jgi:DNA-binding NarL/FixJ family response regulator
LLPAYVELTLAAGDVESALEACGQLDELAAGFGTELLQAVAAQARGALELARGDGEAASARLHESCRHWQELDAPYELAVARVLLGKARRLVDDEEGCELELEAARRVFVRLGASPALAWMDSLIAGDGDVYGLTVRELEVLRLVAKGKSNREIAADLVISEHTVARHVQNIFTKLGVTSRTAAGAFAFQHDLV